MLTQEEKRIKIAEACGWKRSQPVGKWCHPKNWSMARNGSYEVWVGKDKLPNYFNDLNACHELEQWLEANKASRCGEYIDNIKIIIAQRTNVVNWKSVGDFRVKSAKADILAEAFGKTLSLW